MSAPTPPPGSEIDTGGGAVVDGSVQAGGDFAGRDKIVQGVEVHGDQVQGDKIVYEAAPPPARLFSNVPPRPSHRFVGREEALAAAIAQLADPQRPALAVAGLPGAGKTALAVEIAYDTRTAAHFAGGVLWGSLGTQPSPETILNQWAAALGVDLAGLAGLPARMQRLSAAVGDRRTLVVLDDAWDDATPALLRLAAPNAVHLLTTRSPEIAATFAGADRVVHLPVLADDPGFALLQELAPEACAADPAATRVLVQAVGNLPLAIVLLGGYLRSTGSKHFGSLRKAALAQAGSAATRLTLAAKRLGVEPGSDVSLAAAISLSLRGAADPVREAFYALGAFAAMPAHFDLPAAKAVTGADEDVLGVLIDRNLVAIDSSEQMTLHQVIADVARTKMPPEAVVRQREYYLALVARDPHDWQAIALVYAQIKQSWTALPPDDTEGALAFVVNLSHYQEGQGFYLDKMVWAEKALALARADARSKDTGSMLLHLGYASSALGDRQQALAYYEQALRLSHEVGDQRHQAQTLHSIGKVYFAVGDRQQALTYYEQALRLQRQVPDKHGEAATLHSIGAVYSALGDKQQARTYYEQALPLYRDVGDKSGEATTLINIGRVFSDFGDQQQALTYCLQALPLKRLVGDKRGEAQTLNHIGAVYFALGDTQQALAYHEQALRLRRQVNDKGGEAQTLNNIGLVYSALGDKQLALRYYEQALPLRNQVGDKGGKAATLNNIGRVYADLGDTSRALGYYEQALPLRCQVGDRWGEAATRFNIAMAAADLGDLPRAEEELQTVVAIDEATGRPDLESDRAALEKIRARRRG